VLRELTACGVFLWAEVTSNGNSIQELTCMSLQTRCIYEIGKEKRFSVSHQRGWSTLQDAGEHRFDCQIPTSDLWWKASRVLVAFPTQPKRR
jgi:hypothetical protein